MPANVAFFQVDDCLWWFARRRNRRFNGLNAVSDYMNASILEQAIFQNDGSAGNDHFFTFGVNSCLFGGLVEALPIFIITPATSSRDD
jgi:hypothetical protein